MQPLLYHLSLFGTARAKLMPSRDKIGAKLNYQTSARFYFGINIGYSSSGEVSIYENALLRNVRMKIKHKQIPAALKNDKLSAVVNANAAHRPGAKQGAHFYEPDHRPVKIRKPFVL